MIENTQGLISDFIAALGAPLVTPIFHAFAGNATPDNFLGVVQPACAVVLLWHL